MNKIIKNAFFDAIGIAVYIVLIVLFMSPFQIFSSKKDIVIIPIAMLLLFVSSAALTGFLMFGRPAILYLDGKKKEAISLLAYTLGFLFLITLIVFILIILYYSLVV